MYSSTQTFKGILCKPDFKALSSCFCLSFFLKKASPSKDVHEKPEGEMRTKETDRSPGGPKPRQQPNALFARGTRKAVRSPQRLSSRMKEKKHPFALYGWGEKQMDTGSQKTHNVCASAPVHEVCARAPLLGGGLRDLPRHWLSHAPCGR